MGVLQSLIEVSSPAFAEGQPIPRRHAHADEGGNVSPPLSWSNLPDGTRQVAVLCEDPDAPRDEPFVHWIVYGIPPTVTGLPEGFSSAPRLSEVPDAAVRQGRNDFGAQGWGGPLPPREHGRHRYHFHVYALDRALEAEPGLSKQQLMREMRGHVLGQGALVGTYERR